MPGRPSYQAQRADRRALIAQDIVADPMVSARALAKKHDVSQTTIRNVMREIKAEEGVGTEMLADPVVFEREGQIYANSRDVAAYFGKRHGHVLRDIDNLLKTLPDPNLGSGWFVVVEYEDGNGQMRRSFDMTRDGFTMIGFGFTGAKAVAFKARYIERFNAMEAELRKPVVTNIPDFSDSKVLLSFLVNSTKKNIVLESKVQEQRIEIEFKDSVIERLTPEAEAIRRIAKAEGCYCITDAGKALDMGQKAMFEWLKANGWIYRRPFNATWIPYQDKINAGYMVSKVWVQPMPDATEKVRMQPLVTANGLTQIAKLMFKTPPKSGGAASQTNLPV
jgi:anti-repressor protein